MSPTPPRFLADESCDFAVVRGLRAAGYDVLAVCEFMQCSIDSELMELAYEEQRILLTEDKDFGWLVFVTHAQSAGVILIRFPGNARETLAKSVLQLLEGTAHIENAFVVMQPGTVRISQKPSAE